MLRRVQNILFVNSNRQVQNVINNPFSMSAIYRNDGQNDYSNKNLKEEIEKMIKKNTVVIFMKGTPNAPRCGFSKGVVQILNLHKVNYDAYNVLDSETLRNGIKEFSNWPTIPQVFFKGDFVGGYDILADMHQTGELTKELEKLGIKSTITKNS